MSLNRGLRNGIEVKSSKTRLEYVLGLGNRLDWFGFNCSEDLIVVKYIFILLFRLLDWNLYCWSLRLGDWLLNLERIFLAFLSAHSKLSCFVCLRILSNVLIIIDF